MSATMRALGGRLVVASHNAHKVREIADLLSAFPVEVISAAALGLPEPEETGATFVENARLKAFAAAIASGAPALADDSGFCAEALGGAPGIYSARWAGPDKDFYAAMRTVEEKLRAVGATTPAARRGAFVAALALAWPDGEVRDFVGSVEGTIVWPPRGDRGFGYDPMFQPDGHALTFGEMDDDQKHGRDVGVPLSHRARAFALVAAALLPGAPAR
jgi:XTP/dITP diphosphohydrolase